MLLKLRLKGFFFIVWVPPWKKNPEILLGEYIKNSMHSMRRLETISMKPYNIFFPLMLLKKRSCTFRTEVVGEEEGKMVFRKLIILIILTTSSPMMTIKKKASIFHDRAMKDGEIPLMINVFLGDVCSMV
jgi:hypothetical protein